MPGQKAVGQFTAAQPDTGRVHVLDRRGGGSVETSLQLAHQLPSAQRVEQIDVTGRAGEDVERQRRTWRDQPGARLVRVLTVTKVAVRLRIVNHDRPGSIIR